MSKYIFKIHFVLPAALFVFLAFAGATYAAPTCSHLSLSPSNCIGSGGTFITNAMNVSGATNVRFPTWSSVNGQDDLVWYNGGNGGWYWSNQASRSSHPGPGGTITVHVYMDDATGSYFCGGADIGICGATATAYLDNNTTLHKRIGESWPTLTWYTSDVVNGTNSSSNGGGSPSNDYCNVSGFAGVGGWGAFSGSKNTGTGSTGSIIRDDMVGCWRDINVYGYNIDGQASNVGSAIVYIHPRYPSANMWVSPASVTAGGYTTYGWSSSNASYCSFYINGAWAGDTNNGWAFNNPGGWSDGPLWADKTYQINCQNTDGEVVSSSATVRVSPTCSSAAAQAPSTTATSGGFYVYAYGVRSDVTAVNFAVWGDPGGQDDLMWYTPPPGNVVNLGGGTWRATVDLGAHKAGNPEYGNFNVHVYMNNPYFTNTWCGTANFTRNLALPVVTLTGSSIYGGSGQGTRSVYYGEAAGLSWTATEGASGCSLYQNGGFVGSYSYPAVTSYTTPGITSSTNYVLQCGNANGVANSNTITFVPPPPPTGPTHTCNAAGTSATMSWTLPPGYTLNYFRAYDTTVGWACNNTTDVCISGTGNSYTWSVIPGRTISWWVHTRDPNNNYSSAVSDGNFVCNAPLPTVTAAATPSSVTTPNSFTLTMSSTNATSCTWTRTGSYAGNWTNQPVPAPNTSYNSGALAWPPGNATWTFTCQNSTGQTASASASVTVVANACYPDVNPPNYGQACTSAPNACGQTSSGTYTCSGTCSASPPANPPGYGTACSSPANSCGAVNSGTIQCNGSCSAQFPPADPPNLGQACLSSANLCGVRNVGTIQCSGACSAAQPDNTSCGNPPTNPPTPPPDAACTTLSASPLVTGPNGSTTLTWSASCGGGQQCSLYRVSSGAILASSASGSQVVSSISGATTFGLTCTVSGVNYTDYITVRSSNAGGGTFQEF